MSTLVSTGPGSQVVSLSHPFHQPRVFTPQASAPSWSRDRHSNNSAIIGAASSLPSNPHFHQWLAIPPTQAISLIHFLINRHLNGSPFVKISQLTVQVLSLIIAHVTEQAKVAVYVVHLNYGEASTII